MTEKFERSIKEWYENSRTANLEYLDLAENPKNKDYLKTICNNTSVIFDRLSLFSKVAVKNFHELKNQNLELIQKVEKLTIRIKILEHQKAPEPLTQNEVRKLVFEISQQPKFAEEQVLRIATELELKLNRVEQLLQEIKNFL